MAIVAVSGLPQALRSAPSRSTTCPLTPSSHVDLGPPGPPCSGRAPSSRHHRLSAAERRIGAGRGLTARRHRGAGRSATSRRMAYLSAYAVGEALAFAGLPARLQSLNSIAGARRPRPPVARPSRPDSIIVSCPSATPSRGVWPRLCFNAPSCWCSTIDQRLDPRQLIESAGLVLDLAQGLHVR